jgi:hypothetical protein
MKNYTKYILSAISLLLALILILDAFALDPSIFKRKSIGSMANCEACHITAEKGIYDDDDVKIPE